MASIPVKIAPNFDIKVVKNSSKLLDDANSSCVSDLPSLMLSETLVIDIMILQSNQSLQQKFQDFYDSILVLVPKDICT